MSDVKDGHRLHKILVDPMILVDVVTVDLELDEVDEVIDRIHNCVDSLPSEEREVIELQVWAQMTIREIGAELGLHRHTVRHRLRRGKAKLRDQLGDLY